MLKARKKNNCRGTATVETAIILVLLLSLTFGVIEYGWLFLKKQQITNAARNGARVAIRWGATNATVTARISNLMDDADIGGYSITFTPGDVGSVTVGDPLAVRVSVPVPVPRKNGNIVINFPFIPKPTTLGASVTMSKEGP